MTLESISVSALIVAYGAEPELGDCIDALLASEGALVDVVVIDNGDESGHLTRFVEHPRVDVHRPGSNLGFAGGCNLAAERATGGVLALVNPDAIVAPTALARLAAVACEPGVGIATASVRLADAPGLMNSAGNPVHYLGLAWAGGHGDPAEMHSVRVPVASASGACCAIRADLWRELGGFDPSYFAYHEDVELSLRCWQRGRQVVYVPDAVVLHHYEFSRNALKNYLLERNRLVTVLTTYSGRTLLLLGRPPARSRGRNACGRGVRGMACSKGSRIRVAADARARAGRSSPAAPAGADAIGFRASRVLRDPVRCHKRAGGPRVGSAQPSVERLQSNTATAHLKGFICSLFCLL